jgi:hypothetical protein
MIPHVRQVKQMSFTKELSMDVEIITLVKSHVYRLLGIYEERNTVNEEVV